jgi:uncharacterized membrane protein YhhN
MKILPLFVAFVSAIMPVITQKTGLSSKYSFKMKMFCALMYVATGILSAVLFAGVTDYSLLILGALVSGFLGDFFLSYKNDRYFPVGMAFFALGHIVYISTFLVAGNYEIIGSVIYIIISAVILFVPVAYVVKTKINTGKLKLPVLVYGFILVLFFVCSITKGIYAVSSGNLSYGLCMIAGAVLFIASDIMLGLRTGGLKLPKILRHAVSYTYFPAQTLFALSIYFQ